MKQHPELSLREELIIETHLIVFIVQDILFLSLVAQQDHLVMDLSYRNLILQLVQLLEKLRLTLVVDHFPIRMNKETLDSLQMQVGMELMQL